ncbi:hypothetical protein AWC38_SpisGene18638 [Stylophora pistillata]|uniref:YqaJ viral recombinase domain-containing protein n=1 Tax=Stylophora pistillata TaxID=50429 RepID=A0A2B4RFC1_STYPI|nr:hypothetical protein AWC38_SpisGene18638 [Stylophora pistillata]
MSGSVGGCVGSISLYVGSQDSFVIFVNDLFCIVHAAVTDLDCVSVEDFSKLMVFREVFVYQYKEFMPDVSAGVLAERAATDRSGARNLDPVKCKLYEARGPKLRQVDMQHVLSNVEMMWITDKPPPFSYLLSDQAPIIKVNAVFGNVPFGSPLVDQLQDFGRPNKLRSTTNLDFDTCPDFFQSNLSLDLAEAQALEKRTVLQGESKEWLEQHKLRLTASSFSTVFQRVHRPSKAMVKSLFANKDLSKVRAIAHGKANERVARAIFARNKQKVTKTFTVLDAGLCVNPLLTYLGASPDGKIFDPLVDPCYDLLEIRCPFSKRADTLEQALAIQFNNSSPENLSADKRPTVDRQMTDYRPTVG